jgi:cytochrome c
MRALESSSVLLGATALAAVDKKAERAWKAKCAACHGQAGKGDTEKGKELKVEDRTCSPRSGGPR